MWCSCRCDNSRRQRNGPFPSNPDYRHKSSVRTVLLFRFARQRQQFQLLNAVVAMRTDPESAFGRSKLGPGWRELPEVAVPVDDRMAVEVDANARVIRHVPVID
jgi:hypothetical protein